MEFRDPTRIEHRWELVTRGDGKSKSKRWVCRHCNATVTPTDAQLKSNSFGKPSRKRKIDGYYCGERIVSQIHES
jgi:hypothetical protein